MKEENKTIVCIDSRVLQYEANGLSRYLRETIYGILNQSNKFKFILISHKEIIFKHQKDNLYSIVIDNNYSYLPGTIWLLMRANNIAKKHEAEIFWSPTHITPIYKIKKMKYLLSVHDLVADILPTSMELKNRVINKFLFKSSIIISDYIVCLTKTTLKDLKYFYPLVQKKKTSVVYPGKSLNNDGSLVNLGSSNYLFALGSIEPRKNIMFLIKSFELLIKDFKDFKDLKLYITGAHGWKNNDILNYVDQKDLKSSVIFTGFLTDYEIQHHFYMCSAFIFPSLYEGLGLPLLEAENKAVAIVSDIEVFKELGEHFDNMNFVDFINCPAETAGNIANILQRDTKEILKFKVEKDERIFTWKNSSQKVINIFNQLLEKNS